jgi:anti-sigma B factor antagonist
MPLRTIQNGSDYELLVSGRVDGQLANELEIAILAVIKGGASSIAINMAEVNFLCSAGIRVLLQYARQMKNAGKALQVSSPSAEVKAVLESTGFATMILENPQRR